jgi:hypothetical protein
MAGVNFDGRLRQRGLRHTLQHRSDTLRVPSEMFKFIAHSYLSMHYPWQIILDATD